MKLNELDFLILEKRKLKGNQIAVFSGSKGPYKQDSCRRCTTFCRGVDKRYWSQVPIMKIINEYKEKNFRVKFIKHLNKLPREEDSLNNQI